MRHQLAYQGTDVFTRRERVICSCGEIFDSEDQFIQASTQFAKHLQKQWLDAESCDI